MPKILSWEKPEKIMPVEDWKKISADGAPPGVYRPNMSNDDMMKWKAKLVGKMTDDPRVEIQKSFYYHNGKSYPNHVTYSSQSKIVVSLSDPKILISTNGKIPMTHNDLLDLTEAIEEAHEVLKSIKAK